MSLGAWISLINQKMNIEGYTEEAPYFLNIEKGSLYFDAVQTSVEWGILDNTVSFDPEELLTKEWVAYTLMNLQSIETNGTVKINDLNKSQFSNQISKAVSTGLMKLDKRKCFNPHQIMDKNEAEGYLDVIVHYIDTKEYAESKVSFDWKDDLVLVEETPIQFDEDSNNAVFSSDSPIQKGDTVHWVDDNQNDYFYEVDKVEPYNLSNSQEEENLDEIKVEEGKQVSLSPVHMEDVFDSIQLEDSFDLDFTHAEVESLLDDDLFEIENDSLATSGIYSIQNLASTTADKTWNGYKITYGTNGGKIHVKLSKETDFGAQLYGDFSIYDIKPTVKWETSGANIENAYFRVDFKTNQSLGLKRGTYKNLYGDLSNFHANDFFQSVTSMFKEKKDIADVYIPICSIKVPIPSAPIFTINMQLQLHVYASGRAELTLTHTHSLGMEIKNNHMRIINENTHNAEFIIKASMNCMAGVKLGVHLANIGLMDMTVEAGAKSLVQSIVHLYEDDGSLNSTYSDVSADILDELADGNNDVKICADLKAYWAMDVSFNSNKTIAGKIGIKKTLHVFDENNAPLIPGMKYHLENWQFVDKCTRTSRPIAGDHKQILITDTIKIKDYSLIVDAGETMNIQVTGLPKGYEKEDVIFISSNPSIVSVNSSGQVHGIMKGNAIVSIATKDNLFSIKCNVLVKENSK